MLKQAVYIITTGLEICSQYYKASTGWIFIHIANIHQRRRKLSNHRLPT